MARIIKRKIRTTECEVVDENGQRVTLMRISGNVSAPRMANIVRRDKENPLLSVRNVVATEKVYYMTEEEFMQHAHEMTEFEENEKEL